ncbi:hypothetical protein H0H92_005588 [Tricholoma furcatifolium]|nr:hypothetical protein H0H92_005588 [Tricholoma furcatifolium]
MAGPQGYQSRPVTARTLSPPRDCCQEFFEPSSCLLLDGAFPVLSALIISGCSHRLSQMLNEEHLPYNVSSLTVENMKSNGDDLCYWEMAKRFSKVTELVLRDDTEDQSMPFASLRPFLRHNLTRLTLSTYLPLAFQSFDIEEIIRSLPLVEHLDLGTRLKRMNGDSPVGTITLNHFVLFARHCPRLITFGVMVNTSVRNFEDVDSAAILLSELLPIGCEVVSSKYEDQSFLETLTRVRAVKGIAIGLESSVQH